MKKLLAIAVIVGFAVGCSSLPKHPGHPNPPDRGDRPTLTTPDGQKFKAGDAPPAPKVFKGK